MIIGSPPFFLFESLTVIKCNFNFSQFSPEIRSKFPNTFPPLCLNLLCPQMNS